MWAIKNLTPFKVGKTWGRDKNGIHEWIVAVKATYDIKPDGSLQLAEKQLDPLLLPEYNGEDGLSSLRYDADLVAQKPTTDVILNGTAYAPKGRPTSEFMVSMRIGAKQKILKVAGNRCWKRGAFGLSPSSVEPVAMVPIVYERAYGGFDQSDPDPKNQRMDARNPVGCGLLELENQPLPNFEYPDGKLEKAGPAGYGALDSFWLPRREFAGTYDQSWMQERMPLFPKDWDSRSLLCSPADQRPDTHLRGGELVELVNLNSSGRLSFVLPTVYLAFTTLIDRRKEEHSAQLATVIIEPDYPRVILVWQSSFQCFTNMDYLEETVVWEKGNLQ